MRTILVVDDTAIFREPIDAVLRNEGYEVLLASDGAKALELLATSQPDLVILDIGLPLKSGLDVLRLMRAQERLRCLPVIMLTADTTRQTILEVARLNVAGYILKSRFSLKSLLEKVQGVFDKTQAQESHSDGPQSARRPASDSLTPHHAQCSYGQSSPAEVLKSYKPLVSRSDLLARTVSEDDLAGFSPAVAHVLRLTDTTACSMDELASAVGRDHAIALKVLRLANSPLYSRGEPIDSVHSAVTRMGTQHVRQAVLSLAVVDRFTGPAFSSRLNTEQFWEHAVACGVIASMLVPPDHARREHESHSAFTAGLLHDVGRLIYAERLSEVYSQVLDTAAELHLPLELVESRLLLLNHADIMPHVMRTWGLPRNLISPIAYHHLPASEAQKLPERDREPVLRVSLANRLAHAMLLGMSGNPVVYAIEDHLTALAVEPSTIHSIEQSISVRVEETKLALIADSPLQAWKPLAEAVRAGLTAPFRPLFVSTIGASDAFALLCGKLATFEQESPAPNIAVVHAATPRDRASLAERLRNAERQAGVSPLPLLVLSNGAQAALPEQLLAARRFLALPLPVGTEDFVQAVNKLMGKHAVRAAA